MIAGRGRRAGSADLVHRNWLRFRLTRSPDRAVLGSSAPPCDYVAAATLAAWGALR